MRARENKGETIAFRISEELYDALTEIATNDRRKLSDVGRGLLERGYTSFLRDGLIFEPGPPGGNGGEEQTTAKVKPGQSRTASKKKLAGQQSMTALNGGNTPEVVKVDPDGTVLVRGRAREVKFAEPPKRVSRA